MTETEALPSPLPARPELVEGPPFPAGLNVDLIDILGMMCFQAGPIAHRYAQAGLYVDGRGKPLPNRAEPEQAFVIRRMLVHYLRDPNKWRSAFGEELEAVLAYARAATTNGGAA